jgi:hypothetical protein
MASGSTPTYLIPYPLPTDPVNVASDIEELADRLEILFGNTVTASGSNTFTNTNIFSVNSASTAVRITQVGSGNALLVEDDANPDTSAFVVTNAGDVGIGKLSPGEKLDVAGNIKLTGNLIFEGASEDNHELSIVYTNPTVDRTITLPDVTGTVITTGNLSSITSVGTIASGIWTGTAISAAYGGTGIASYGTGDLLYASASNALSALNIGSSGQVLTVSGGLPVWAAAPVSLPSQTGNAGELLVTDGTTASWSNAVTANAVGSVGFIVQGLSGQTANLQEWKDSAGNIFVQISSSGELSALRGANIDGSTQTISIGTSQTTGVTNIGSTSGTGAITIGRSTAAQTVSVANGATATSTTKTVNIGTEGLSGSTTNINIGSAVSGALGTITINEPTLFPAPTTTTTSIRLPHGTAPSSPTNGDVWTTTAGIYVRINGNTVGPLGSGSGGGDAKPDVFMLMGA